MLGTISILTPKATTAWSITVRQPGASALQPLPPRKQRDEDLAFLVQAHWLDGEPITDILAMSGIVDRYRRFVVDGAPVATGFLSVADAWACTNPSAGRGLTVGFLHALRLRDALRETRDDPHALACRFDELTEADVTPWYDAQITADRIRFAEIEALREEREPPRPTDVLGEDLLALFTTMAADPDLFRAGLEYIGTITPIQQLVRRPDVAGRMRAALEAMAGSPPLELPGPSRRELLDLMA